MLNSSLIGKVLIQIVISLAVLITNTYKIFHLSLGQLNAPKNNLLL